MRVTDIIQRAIDFGTLRSRDHFVSFTLKILLYIIPAAILGHYTDAVVKKRREENTFGENRLLYILLQTLIIISTLYLILKTFSDYISEFQVTIAGGYFIVLYFGMQTNYIHMIQDYLYEISRE